MWEDDNPDQVSEQWPGFKSRSDKRRTDRVFFAEIRTDKDLTMIIALLENSRARLSDHPLKVAVEPLDERTNLILFDADPEPVK